MANRERIPSKVLSVLQRLSMAALCGLLLTSPSQARLSTSNYICSELKDLIFQQGAIVLNTKGDSVYQRFVADRSFCKANEAIKRINVPTKSEKCRVIYCVPSSRNNDN